MPLDCNCTSPSGKFNRASEQSIAEAVFSRLWGHPHLFNAQYVVCTEFSNEVSHNHFPNVRNKHARLGALPRPFSRNWRMLGQPPVAATYTDQRRPRFRLESFQLGKVIAVVRVCRTDRRIDHPPSSSAHNCASFPRIVRRWRPFIS